LATRAARSDAAFRSWRRRRSLVSHEEFFLLLYRGEDVLKEAGVLFVPCEELLRTLHPAWETALPRAWRVRGIRCLLSA
jgi:hypothetical protein